MGFWTGKRIVVGISGGIAAYKTLELLRLLRREGAELAVVLTQAAQHFITPLSAQALSGGGVHVDLFSLTSEREMGHIQLARQADLVIVAPTTANGLGKLANGLADDLLSTMLLARRGPVLLAPAMNSAMWEHPATQRNVAQLRQDGVHLVGPERGSLACGEEGEGRMAEPVTIMEQARRLLTPQVLAGRHLLITAGPTREELDPVRYISNHSSGKMGWAVALAGLRAGASVTLIHGPVALAAPLGAIDRPVTSARAMLEAALTAWPQCDAAILTAAVADYRPQERESIKVKKGAEGWNIPLTLNPDILQNLVATARRTDNPQVVVGFAAETNDALEQGRRKRARKGCDLMAVNDVTEAGCGFGSDTNRVVLLFADGRENSLPLMSKDDVGEQLVLEVATLLHCKDSP